MTMTDPDPKTPNEEPRRVSFPEYPDTPLEAPPSPQTEFEHDVPHTPNQPVG